MPQKIMKYKKPGSQIGQDKWVIKTLRKKKNGTFVDIGSGHPVTINNTYLLEKEYDWSGISIDLGLPTTATWNTWKNPAEYKSLWGSERNTTIIIGNALEMNFLELFKENNLPKVIDYLTIDINPVYASLECLYKIPFGEYQFNTITFEIAYRHDPTIRDPSRKFCKTWAID